MAVEFDVGLLVVALVELLVGVLPGTTGSASIGVSLSEAGEVEVVVLEVEVFVVIGVLE